MQRFEIGEESHTAKRTTHDCVEHDVKVMIGQMYFVIRLAMTDACDHDWISKTRQKICFQCQLDWEIERAAEKRATGQETCLCLGKLKERIRVAHERGWLESEEELEMYRRWFPSNAIEMLFASGEAIDPSQFLKEQEGGES